MGSRPFRAHLGLLVILYLALMIGGAGAGPGPGVNLERSDSDALRQFMKDLGVNGQHISRLTDPNPCQWAGISCERRIFVGLPVARVTRIRLGSRRLTGFLSSVIGGLSELKELSLPNNHLFDQIPHQIGECRKLEILNLGNNELSGKVPSQITSLIRLRVLDLSYNRISGDLRFLNHFPNLENLSLSDNLFEGKIPLSLKSFRNLRFLNLSNNHLHYPEPLERIENLDILSLPKRHRLAENSTRSRRNNTSALSPTSPVSGNGSTSAAAPPPSNSTRQHHNKMKKHHKHLKSTILGFFVGLFAGVLSGAVLSLLFRSLLSCIRGRGKTSGPEIFSPLIKNAEDLAFLEKEDGLSSLEVIGRGGCGEVYKAELPGSGGAKHIAIKKIVQPAMDGADLTEEDSRLLNKRMRQIRSEIQTVGHIRHRNLLPLVAHVCRPDCHFLVYEFMNNGSLQDALTQVKEGTRDLDWLTRHKIAMGIAAGLEYLHKSHSPRIIHRDLKPANILLDDDMEARIADFGLAKAVPEAYTHVTTSNLAGTVGYIAPEYHQTLKFTDKCDIYSFGVVLATLVMGRLPSDDFFQNTEEMSLVKWMKNVMASDDPCRAIDPKLLGKGFEEEMLLVLKIACFCTNEEGKQRPDSKEVRCMLSQVQK